MLNCVCDHSPTNAIKFSSLCIAASCLSGGASFFREEARRGGALASFSDNVGEH